ncbi:MAG: alkyl hydroperoxide reductase, partial [Novipirellula sp. JB048]
KHSEVTYSGQVAEILRKRCVECHRDGEIAPFSLTDYDEVAGWADMIAEVVREGRMPPWHASGAHLPLANDRAMSDEEKELLFAWAEAGSPPGDLSALPPLPKKVFGWQLPREPDLVVPVSPTVVPVPATGAVRYQYYRVDPELDHDVWIEAAELKPGNREVVHHILAFAVPKGTHQGLDAARGFLVGYVPGSRVELAPAGYAKRIPAGSELIFQVHYTPIGMEQEDQSQLGICFADPDSITHQIVTTSALQTKLKIPPGEANYKTSATSPRFPAEATLLSMSPHMHVRGKSFRYELETETGERTMLLDIPHYDFNWQSTYVLRDPLPVPAGSRVVCTATYDNSEANLNNPDPTATVRWGDQTWDEMMIGYYHYAVPFRGQPRKSNNKNTSTQREKNAALIRSTVRLKKFEQLDRDGDGKLIRGDTPKQLHPVFDELDANRDGILTRHEVESAP